MAEQPSGVYCKSVGGLKAKPTKTGRSYPWANEKIRNWCNKRISTSRMETS